MEKELRLAYELPLRGILRVPNTKQLVNQTMVSRVMFNHGGSHFAVITGNCTLKLTSTATFVAAKA